jgi:two-component system alkaline phosphatase synthesis response regulator PhoP
MDYAFPVNKIISDIPYLFRKILTAGERGNTPSSLFQIVPNSRCKYFLNISVIISNRIILREKSVAGKRVLVVDDDEKTVELVKLYLNRDGYKVDTAYNGLDALELARKNHPDLIVLDLMLPGMDGLEVCRTLRQESDVPIIMLTARSTDQDKLTGLETGADDYVTKPFSPRELAARVRVVLRRMPGERGPDVITHGKLTVDFLKHETSIEKEIIPLTEIEFKLLGALIREPGRVFSRAEIIDKALGYGFEGFDRTIDVHILNIRRKMEKDPSKPRYVKTVYGAGYKLSEVPDDG